MKHLLPLGLLLVCVAAYGANPSFGKDLSIDADVQVPGVPALKGIVVLDQNGQGALASEAMSVKFKSIRQKDHDATIRIEAEIQQKLNGKFTLVSSPVLITKLNQRAEISESGIHSYRLQLTPRGARLGYDADQ